VLKNSRRRFSPCAPDLSAIRAGVYKKGSVLVLTLWVVFFLSVMVLSLTHRVRLERRLAGRYADRSASMHVARAVLLLVEDALEKDRLVNDFDGLKEDWSVGFNARSSSQPLELLDKDQRVWGRTTASVSDESGRLNVNTASEKTLERLLALSQVSGAERLAHNIASSRRSRWSEGRFMSASDLLGIEGLTREIFFGKDGLGPGLKDFLTVFTDGKVNVNTAPAMVLLSLPGTDEAIVSSLVARREREPFRSVEDIKHLPSVTDGAFAQIAAWAAVRSDIFRVFIEAEADKAQVKRRILVIIDRSVAPAEVRYWQED
jgi:type II secretory pathway component PulK